MALPFSLSDSSYVSYIIILMFFIFGIALVIARLLKIKDYVATTFIFAILLISANAFEVLPQIYAFVGFIIISIIIYVKLNESKEVNSE